MSQNPWKTDVWTERQAAWFLAKLPEIEFEAWKVEGETDDAFPEMEPHPEALEVYLASGNSVDHSCRWPVVVGPPTLSRSTTPEGKRAYGWLEKLRKAVRWRLLHPVDGQIMYWDGRMWTKIHIDDFPEDAEPIRFKIETAELMRWVENERMTSCTAPAHKGNAVGRRPECSPTTPSASRADKVNGFYVVALRLAIAGGAPSTREALLEDMDLHGIKRIGKNTLDSALRAARDESLDVVIPCSLKGQAGSATQRLLQYAYFRYTLPKQWTMSDRDAAKKKWRETKDEDRLGRELGNLMREARIKPIPTGDKWRAVLR